MWQYQRVADALCMTFDFTAPGSLPTGHGVPMVRLLKKRFPLNLELCSTVIDKMTGEWGGLVAALGDLGFAFETDPATKRFSLYVVDRSELPDGGWDLCESAGITDVFAFVEAIRPGIRAEYRRMYTEAEWERVREVVMTDTLDPLLGQEQGLPDEGFAGSQD